MKERRRNLKTINKSDFEKILNEMEKYNFDDCLRSSLHGKWKDVAFHKGYESCILRLKDYYKIKNNIDIYNIIRYL